MSSVATLDAVETETPFAAPAYDTFDAAALEPISRRSSGPLSLRPRPLADATSVAAEGNRSAVFRFVKRSIDVVGSLVVLTMLSPVMLTTFVVLSIATKGRPLYGQIRAGYRGRPFWMWKFRTMRLDAERLQHTVHNEADGPVFKNRRDPRVTRIGYYLRKFSIDETPQLFSVLLGEMSLVGPRPLPAHEMARVKPWQRRRLAVRPGLTCLWQVSGRSNVGFEQWARMDVWYVENQSLLTDMWLLLRTPLTVLTGRGAY
jgi:lipopolysaccharide/colanic/teichoic acid biosynthesis glycosyltransferase